MERRRQRPLPDSSGFATGGGAPLIRLYFRGIQSPRCDPSSQDPDTCETINVCSAVFRKFVPPADSGTRGPGNCRSRRPRKIVAATRREHAEVPAAGLSRKIPGNGVGNFRHVIWPFVPGNWRAPLMDGRVTAVSFARPDVIAR